MRGVELTKQPLHLAQQDADCSVLTFSKRLKSTWINGPSSFIHLSIVVLFVLASFTVCSTYATKAGKPVLESDVIENVDAAKLFHMIEEHEYLAVFFCKYFHSQSNDRSASCTFATASSIYSYDGDEEDESERA